MACVQYNAPVLSSDQRNAAIVSVSDRIYSAKPRRLLDVLSWSDVKMAEKSTILPDLVKSVDLSRDSIYSKNDDVLSRVDVIPREESRDLLPGKVVHIRADSGEDKSGCMSRDSRENFNPEHPDVDAPCNNGKTDNKDVRREPTDCLACKSEETNVDKKLVVGQDDIFKCNGVCMKVCELTCYTHGAENEGDTICDKDGDLGLYKVTAPTNGRLRSKVGLCEYTRDLLLLNKASERCDESVVKGNNIFQDTQCTSNGDKVDFHSCNATETDRRSKVLKDCLNFSTQDDNLITRDYSKKGKRSFVESDTVRQPDVIIEFDDEEKVNVTANTWTKNTDETRNATTGSVDLNNANEIHGGVMCLYDDSGCSSNRLYRKTRDVSKVVYKSRGEVGDERVKVKRNHSCKLYSEKVKRPLRPTRSCELPKKGQAALISGDLPSLLGVEHSKLLNFYNYDLGDFFIRMNNCHKMHRLNHIESTGDEGPVGCNANCGKSSDLKTGHVSSRPKNIKTWRNKPSKILPSILHKRKCSVSGNLPLGAMDKISNTETEMNRNRKYNQSSFGESKESSVSRASSEFSQRFLAGARSQSTPQIRGIKKCNPQQIQSSALFLKTTRDQRNRERCNERRESASTSATRKKGIEATLQWLRTELASLREQDESILKQLEACRTTIDDIKLTRSRSLLLSAERHWEDWELEEYERSYWKPYSYSWSSRQLTPRRVRKPLRPWRTFVLSREEANDIEIMV